MSYVCALGCSLVESIVAVWKPLKASLPAPYYWVDGGDADRTVSLDRETKPSMYVGKAMDQRSRPGFQASISNHDAFSWVEEAANHRS